MKAAKTRDERIADDVAEDRTMLCCAIGCPNRWTVDAGQGRLCTAHARAEPTQWPWITQQQLDAQTQRALQAQQLPLPAAPVPDRAAAAAALGELQRTLRSSSDRAWALQLRDRELHHGGVLASGRRMTPFHRQAWRAVLGDGEGRS
jgi:hypothetical protein